MIKKILFLGYSKKETQILDFLNKKKDIKVTNYNKKLKTNSLKGFDLVICFGYRHIIDESIIKANNIPIINLHIGYLPYNRGAHPNFWSFVENTPSGVTIHKINKNVDTGKIIDQKQIDFNLQKNRNKLTFRDTYKVLIREIENLFINNFDGIITNNYKEFVQIGRGTFHKKNDLPDFMKNWDQNIYKTVIKFQRQRKNKLKKNLDIIAQIENTRQNNNVNWMNIIRTSINSSSKETLKILKQINTDDKKISALFRKFNDDK
jgi:methionyl-tRNA formyltransferase